MKADIIGLQEVSFKESNQLNDLVQVDDYEQYLAEAQLCIGEVNDTVDPEFNIDGLAILLSNKLMKKAKSQNHKVLHISATRVAHMLTVEVDDLKVNLINLHLHHPEEDESVRVHQIWSILKWIEYNTKQDDLTIMLGDFNAEPDSKTYQTILEKGYVSSHMKVHSCEPINTFHNRIEAPYKDASPDGTFDYIFVKDNKNSKLVWDIKAVSIHGQEESTVDKGIYASDHYALVAEFVIG